MFYSTIKKIILGSFLALSLLVSENAILLHAETVEELQQKIKKHNDTIADLQKAIDTYQVQITGISKEANTLNNSIKTLDLSKKKLQSSVTLTENKIDSTNLQIERLKIDINGKQGDIEDSRASIANALKQINKHDSESVITTLLSNNTLSDFWDEVDTLERFQSSVSDAINNLQSTKKNLENNKTQTEKKKSDLLKLQKELASQKAALQDTIDEKARLLKETKNKEANYKTLIADTQAQKDAFEQELTQYESQLHLAIDPSKIPSSGKGVLQWPLDKVYITQYFGNTPFATANPQGYSGQGHNGIDFRASIGTPVRAALTGTVSGTGNTSLIKTCLSYGKWVLIEHENGLSTLYGHLSAINVKAGDKVNTGDIIALSGNTGYVTGPHLHFTVFSTQGVRIGTIANTVNCKKAILPISDTHAYLNPLSYLP